MPQYTPLHLSQDELLNHLPAQIGQVSLNYEYYSGQDIYSDGEIEDTLLDIAKNSSKVEYQGIIEKKKSWPILYHLSPIRGNIVDFLPIGPNDKVLEIGSGCGAITGTLAKRAGSVTCVDLSAKRSRINAYRNQDCDNIEIFVGNFTDIEPHLACDYDYVCLIGVFEYGSLYIPSKTPYEDFLNIIMKHCKPVEDGGRVVIAIENRFGLKYWAGCKEDHNGEFFSGLENYTAEGSAKTFTRPALEKIFATCGVGDYHFYYPYPDYKLPTSIYSDKHLPQKGELTDNMRNLDRDRMLLFNESYVFDSIIDDGEFPLFSNSYLVVIGHDIDTEYVKYSNDRTYKYAIRTEILKGNKVRKVALNDVAFEHLKNLETYYKKLALRYEGSALKINRCVIDDNDKAADFDFEKGRTLEEIFDELLFAGDKEGFKALFREYYKIISYNSKKATVTDYDMIFSNILLDKREDGEYNWALIDYEWSYEKDISIKEVAFRALYCYVIEDERRNAMSMDELLEIIGIEPKEVNDYIEAENSFQKYVTGLHKSIGEIRATIGTYSLDSKKLVAKALQEILDKRVQLYYDNGTGFSEANSEYVPDVYVDERNISMDIPFNGNLKGLRIDPADFSCIVRVKELTLNGTDISKNKKALLTNGKAVSLGTFVFGTSDPNVNIVFKELNIVGENMLHIEMEVDPISEDTAENIIGSIKKLF